MIHAGISTHLETGVKASGKKCVVAGIRWLVVNTLFPMNVDIPFHQAGQRAPTLLTSSPSGPAQSDDHHL